jgi:signal transduction histidine kinase
LAVAIEVVFFLSIALYLQITQTGDIIKDQVQVYGTSMANSLSDFCIEDMLSYNYPTLDLSVNYIGRQDSQILGIKIYHEGRVVADYVSDLVDEDNKGAIDTCTLCNNIFVSPVIYDPIDQDPRTLGEVRFYLSDEKYEEFLATQIDLIWILSVVMLLGDIVASFWIIKLLVLNPLKKVSGGAEIMGKGDLDHRIKIENKDEIGNLANILNDMAEKLKRNKNKMSKQTLSLRKFQKTLVETLDETNDAKKKIEEEQNKTSAIIANLVDPVIVVDNNQKIVLVNNSAKQILGIDIESNGGSLDKSSGEGDCLPDRLCLCDFRSAIKAPYYSKVLKYNDRKYPIIEEMVVGTSDDKKAAKEKNRVFKVLTSEVRDKEGVLFGHMKIFYDLTKEKIIDEMKSEFISIAAHQLRTPSSGVKWSLKMILAGEMGKLPKEAKEYIKKAYQANEQMVELVKDLLNVSHIEKGKFLYRFENINFEKVFNDIIKNSKITAKQSNVKLDFSRSEGKIPPVEADLEKIKLAIQNIINNAIKYSMSGQKIFVNLSYNEKDDKYIYISVKDEGIGISKKDQIHLFSKFYRGENAKKLQTEGSGLGLFITKKVFEAHKGEINFESSVDKGTVFHMKIPIKKKRAQKQN